MARRFVFDQNEMREWIEERGGKPAILSGIDTEEIDNEASLLQISFELNDPDIEEISWDEFLDRIEENNLALSYDDEGDPTDFNFVDRSLAGSEADIPPETELPDSQDIQVLEENRYSSMSNDDGYQDDF